MRELEQTLSRLSAVRADPSAPGAADELRAALAARSNLVVARAAEIVAEWELRDTTADLVRAFDRFMTDAVRRDPTCAAKTTVAEALLRLEYDDADLFARGLRHVQPEPVWGGTQDTAAALRATCALGLARANPPDVLLQLADLLADPEADARVGAARAIATAARPGAAPLLWYKTLVGDAEVAPLYACFAGLLALEPDAAPAHVGRFLRAANPALAEAAALALGESRLPAAAPVLREAWAAADDPAQRAACLDALARLGDEAAFDFLLDLLANAPAHDAHNARRALLAAYGDDARRRRKVERVVARRGEID
jgi:HEAT repeat protein